MLPTFFYAEKGDDFYVNQYLSSDYKGKDFAFQITGDYPEHETVTLSVLSSKTKRKSVHFRIPAWCANPQVLVNGKAVTGVRPGSYLSLDRKWAKGEKVTITFPMEEKWTKRSHHSDYQMNYLPGGEIVFKEIPAKRIPYAFTRGPIVYALDMVWNKQICNDDVNMAKDMRVDTHLKPVLSQKPQADMLGPVYRTKAIYMGRHVEVLLTPFANIGQWFRQGEEAPGKYTDAFTYGIWQYGLDDK